VVSEEFALLNNRPSHFLAMEIAYQTYNCFDKLVLMPVANSTSVYYLQICIIKNQAMIDQSAAFEE
jgi:hypothetical protein